MAVTVPNVLALTGIVDGASIVASDHRNNYSAIQVGTNGLIALFTAAATKGDLIVSEGGGTFDKLAVGSNGQVLTADSTQATGIKWASAASVFDYVTATSDVVTASTNGASPTDVLAGTSQSYAAGDYWVEFYCGQVDNTGGGNATFLVDIWDGTTRLQQIAKSFLSNSTSVPLFVRSKVTLTAATHQIKIRAYHITNAFTFRAGAGTAGVASPIFLRVTSI